jgi:hypothetical protein
MAKATCSTELAAKPVAFPAWSPDILQFTGADSDRSCRARPPMATNSTLVLGADYSLVVNRCHEGSRPPISR